MNKSIPFVAVLHKLWNVVSTARIRTKILGIVFALVVLLGGGFTLQIRISLTNALTQQLSSQSVSLAHDLAARSINPLLTSDPYEILLLLRETQLNNPDVRYAFLLDQYGRIVAHTFGDAFPIGLDKVNAVAPDMHHHTLAVDTEEGIIWDTAVPILEGKIGTARVGLSEQRMWNTVNTTTLQLLMTVVAASVIGVAAATLFTWLITRPIQQLVQATEAVRRGDYTPRVGHWANDELGNLADAFNAMTVDLAAAKAERQERERWRGYYLQRIMSAQEEERKRIARELHDETEQALASLMVGLRNVEEASTPDEMSHRLNDLRNIAASTLESVRRLALELRPSALDDLGLEAALRRHVQDYMARFKIQVEPQVNGLEKRRLSSEIETAVYRIVQEALTNVAKYAQAQHVSIVLEIRETGGDDSREQLSLIVEDDGRGFDVENMLRSSIAEDRLGVYGMRERAELLGGTLTVESQEQGGTTVYVRIPL